MKTIGLFTFEPNFFLTSPPLINSLLYFDSIAYIGLEKTPGYEEIVLARMEGLFKPRLIEMEKLRQHGLLIDQSIIDASIERSLTPEARAEMYFPQITEISQELFNLISNRPRNEYIPELVHKALHFNQLFSRAYCSVYNKSRPDHYTPMITYNFENANNNPDAAKTTTLRVVFNKFPTFSLDDPIEAIIDFKKDPDSKLKLDRLKNWVIDVSKGGYSEKELEQKLDTLLHEYEDHIRLHKLQAGSGIIESIIVPGLEFLENVLTLKWSSALKMLVSIHKTEVNLLEAERDAAGKEVAYISKARSAFPQKKG